jgi:crossover junction endodeoxyribonuclease RuvC
MIIAGIDPGLSGAVAFYDSKANTVSVHDMPVVDGEVSAPLLAMLVLRYAPTFGMIERVASMPHDGHVGAFRFGRAVGDARGVFGGLSITLHAVTPQTWKKHYGLIKQDKEASRQLAISLMPAAADSLKRKKDHGRAEAILIALYATYYLKAAGAGAKVV